jgi:hypothetical protein
MEKTLTLTEEQLAIVKAAWTFFFDDGDCYAMVADALELPDEEDTTQRVDDLNALIMAAG